MPIRIACPECRTPYALPETMNSKKVRCMKCNHVMIVTPPEPVEEVLEAGSGRTRGSPATGKARPSDISMAEAVDQDGALARSRKPKRRPGKGQEKEEEGAPPE